MRGTVDDLLITASAHLSLKPAATTQASF